jgi:hypothetical protein
MAGERPLRSDILPIILTKSGTQAKHSKTQKEKGNKNGEAQNK